MLPDLHRAATPAQQMHTTTRGLITASVASVEACATQCACMLLLMKEAQPLADADVHAIRPAAACGAPREARCAMPAITERQSCRKDARARLRGA